MTKDEAIAFVRLYGGDFKHVPDYTLVEISNFERLARQIHAWDKWSESEHRRFAAFASNARRFLPQTGLDGWPIKD